VFELLTAHHQRRTGPIQRLRRIEVAQSMNVGVPVAGRGLHPARVITAELRSRSNRQAALGKGATNAHRTHRGPAKSSKDATD